MKALDIDDGIPQPSYTAHMLVLMYPQSTIIPVVRPDEYNVAIGEYKKTVLDTRCFSKRSSTAVSRSLIELQIESIRSRDEFSILTFIAL